MKDSPQYMTEQLWRSLFVLIGICITLIVALLVYLPLQNDIQAYLNRPKYNLEELQKKADLHARQIKNDWNYVENGIHAKTGMVYDENFKYIQSSCLSCHSSKMITQNKATREGWKQMIRWMQATQNLPNLGDKEVYILDYLAEHYAPENTGRRPNLDMASIEWYVLKLN